MSTQSSSPLSGASPQPAPPASALEDDDRIQTTIIQRAVEVIGDRSDAMRWLGTPVRALDYATPISLLHDSKGRADLLSVLGRIEHGIL